MINISFAAGLKSTHAMHDSSLFSSPDPCISHDTILFAHREVFQNSARKKSRMKITSETEPPSHLPFRFICLLDWLSRNGLLYCPFLSSPI